jgi:hypothetical protein
VREWFRVTAMPEVIMVREDWLLATEHVHYLRTLTYRLFVEGQKPIPPHGVKWWSGKLSEEQQWVLLQLPTGAASLAELVAAHVALSQVFLPAAEALMARLGRPWPMALEQAAARHLGEVWGITDPYPRGVGAG